MFLFWGEKKPKIELEKGKLERQVSLFLSSALSLKVSFQFATTLLSYDFSRLSSLTSTTQPHKVTLLYFGYRKHAFFWLTLVSTKRRQLLYRQLRPITQSIRRSSKQPRLIINQQKSRHSQRYTYLQTFSSCSVSAIKLLSSIEAQCGR